MRRGLAWLGGALGLAALWRFLREEQRSHAPAAEPAPPSGPDPAAELRAKLEQARLAPDDRDDFDAAEGQPVDEAEPREPQAAAEAAAPAEAGATAGEPSGHEPAEVVETRSLEERRRAVHEKAQQSLGEMQQPHE
jgi:hypothetical protein